MEIFSDTIRSFSLYRLGNEGIRNELEQIFPKEFVRDFPKMVQIVQNVVARPDIMDDVENFDGEIANMLDIPKEDLQSLKERLNDDLVPCEKSQTMHELISKVIISMVE